MVGIGASAGGLDALEKLFSAMPADSGLAFVVVQHLDPRHPSILAELLGRRARIPVSTAEDGARPEPDHVYVIAPKTILTIDGGALRNASSPEEPAAGRIDAFLSSLARDRGESAVGIMLSGAGNDGVMGLRAVKDHGGLVLAQDPQTAAHGSMPRAAIEAGLVDGVLAIDQIPAALLAHARHLASTCGASGAGLDADLAGNLRALCALVRQRTGHDFSGYKEATLVRRIRRRVHVQGATSAAGYLRILERDPAEAQRLLKDLLIGVTQFFRDPETFATLARKVLPRILEGKPANAPIRIWVPGCSSGEEAYSIAILVHERLAREKARRVVQIFGTDIDPEMIAEARAGRYPVEIADQVAPERLDRFFVREASAWRVGTELREMCIFSVHSLIRDPPFSALDLISCRNVLIYLEPELQKKVIPLFHYALRTGGWVLLGPAEALANHAELFEAVDRKHRIFRRRETMARPQVEFPLSARAVGRLAPPAPGAAPAPTPRQKADAAIERMLLDDYAPPCAVVDGRGDIEFVAGHLGRFLAPPAGAPTANLLDTVRDSLRRELRTALHAASTSGARVVRDGVPVELEDGVHRVRLTVRPVPGAGGLFAVVVQERALDEVEAPGLVGSAASSPALEQIESELRTTRADLKAAVESAEAANEELRSANEELTSTNEELHSANEEMQTSKEELQSLNEELETVNAELGRKVDELGILNTRAEWLASFPARSPIPTAEVDSEGRVRYANASAERLFPDIHTAGSAHPWLSSWDEVVHAFRELGETSHERIVRIGEAYFQQYMYYVPETQCIRIYSVEVTRRRRAEEAQRESEEKYSVVHERAPFAIVLAKLPDRTIVSVNAAFSRMFGFTAEEAIGKTSVELGIVDAGTQAKVAEELQRRGAVRDLEVTRRTRSGAPLVLSLNLDRVSIRGQEHVLTTIQDVTARDQAEEALRESEERFRTLFETMSEGFTLDEIIFDERGKPSDLRYLQVNPAFERHTGLRAADIVGRTLRQVFPAAEPEWFERYGRVALTGEPAHFLAKFGPLAKWFEISAYRTQPNRIAVVFFDITARKQAEEAVERSRQGLSRLAEASLGVIRETDLQGMLQAVSEAALALTGARLATCGHGYVAGQFTVGGSARAPGAPSCPPGNMFAFEKGGVHLDLAAGAEAIRLGDGELRAHPRWWGLPEGHVPMRGLLGVRMVGRNGQTSGLILVTDKEAGEFTEEDESLLRQLATIASLALQHVEARISLEESDRSKNHFLAVLSHELRNPLAPIRNSVYVLDRAAPGGEQARRAHRVIDRQVGHLTRLVDDLLDVTRISRGKIQLRRERLDLSDLVRRAAEDHRASFASNGLDLEISVPERPLWVAADRTRVAQVVGNLLENSVKFTERGGRASIAVEGNAVLRQAIIRVRDTGAGILADMLPRVFEPFMQADTTLDRSKGGLGLGLALVKGLVEMHGGAVSVESEGPGRGAEFTVRLPLDVSADAPADQPAGPGRGAPRRILVIEDNADAADSLRELLELGKHTVEVAFSGTEGIEKARAFRPDVVLCDIGLPGMNGYQVAREMRTDPALRGTRLVALTGYAAPEDLARSREAGFHAHVAKPPTPEVLEEALSASAPHAPGRPEDP